MERIIEWLSMILSSSPGNGRLIIAQQFTAGLSGIND
jgi:hypothetical protein